MNWKQSILCAGVVAAAIGSSVTSARAQGPLYDKVVVDLPYNVSVNNTVLPPGHYVIRQLDSPGGASRILQIFDDKGMRLKTSAMTIPALDNNTPRNTRVVLHHYGQDYYFDKVWIQGKNYGYEFPIPPAVKSRERERMEPYTVAATYEQTNQNGATSATDQSSVSSESTVTTQSTPPANNPTYTAPASSTTDQSTSTVAQNRPPAPDNSGNTASQPYSAPADTYGSRRMPKTGGEWFTMLFGGGLLSGAGMLLRRSASRTR